MSHPALETLLLPFTREGGLTLPRRALFLGAEAHADFATWPEVIGWQPSRPLADRWTNAGHCRIDEPAGKWPLVMLLPGKSRAETLALFAAAHDLLEPGGHLLAAMPNTAGAGRFEKELARASGGVTSLQKHKCRAFHAALDRPWDEELLETWRAGGRRELIPGTRFTVEAGIFSTGHIDPGSRFLAENLPASLRGDVADLGAGWGFLSHAILEKCPKVAKLDLYEADARALTCARLNLAGVTPSGPPPRAAGAGPEIHFHWHDVTSGLTDHYDVIVMNPPFHTGQATHVDLGQAFIRTAAAALNRGGKLFLVANRQLPYEAALDAAGLAWRNAGESQTYKLLFAERRHRPS